LASKEYKAKVNLYLDTLDELEGRVGEQKKDFNNAKRWGLNESWINKSYLVKVDMTVADVGDSAGGDVRDAMKAYLENQKEQDKYIRKWRDEYKGMAGQLATMKKWAGDADTLEEI
jgi:hypothetical protein